MDAIFLSQVPTRHLPRAWRIKKIQQGAAICGRYTSMAANTRFSMGIGALAQLALGPDKHHTSQSLAASMRTNPVVVRRLLAVLHTAKLVTNSKGPSGGARLSRPPKQITLGDVYRALGPEELFHHAPHGAAGDRVLQGTMQSVFRKARRAVEKELDSVTLSQFVKKIGKKSAKAGAAQDGPQRAS
ncbi:MAG: Rrf2 family transcriptional regulator [Acidobacteriaceae bacterium]